MLLGFHHRSCKVIGSVGGSALSGSSCRNVKKVYTLLGGLAGNVKRRRHSPRDNLPPSPQTHRILQLPEVRPDVSRSARIAGLSAQLSRMAYCGLGWISNPTKPYPPQIGVVENRESYRFSRYKARACRKRHSVLLSTRCVEFDTLHPRPERLRWGAKKLHPIGGICHGSSSCLLDRQSSHFSQASILSTPTRQSAGIQPKDRA